VKQATTDVQVCQKVVLTCPDDIFWVKDVNQMIIVNRQSGETQILRGVEASVWGWLTLCYSYPKMVHLVSALLVVPSGEAEEQLVEILKKWLTAGLLEITELSDG
jgi:hypothetical protein